MSKDFLDGLNRIIDAFDGTPGQNSQADDLLTAIYAIADAIESGGGGSGSGSGSGSGGIMRIIATSSTENDLPVITLDKTWQEIYDFVSGGGFAYIFSTNEYGVMFFKPIDRITVGDESGSPYVVHTSGENAIDYVAYSPNNMPIATYSASDPGGVK